MRIPRLAALAVVYSCACGAASTAGADVDAAPGRLPKQVVPLEYRISLAPDAATLKVRGTETVRIRVRTATDTIVFNTLEITVSDARVDGRAVAGVDSDDASQFTTLRLAARLRPGVHRLALAFESRLQTVPRGMFLQRYELPNGLRGELVSTQLEAPHARRVFPCWDEPAFRARFRLELTAPANWRVVSNMPAAQRSVHGALATTRFLPTPPMASYLVHLTAGDLAGIRTEVDGTELGLWAIRGQEREGVQALLNARQILADYGQYLGVRFPLPKLDSIAIPGGWSGAMENWGAIAYTEQTLLLGPTSSEGAHLAVFSIQAHEMAHLWFGDLVTPAWWNDTWLSESFASWLGARETALRHPEWNWPEQQFARRQAAMDADARATSFAIARRVDDERVADAAFDQAITYSKGQYILQMLEAHLGPEVFRAGLRRYLRAHAYGSVTGADLWAALGAASGMDVAALAAAWVGQPGFPLVSSESSCDATGQRRVTLRQQRFPIAGGATEAASWQVPLSIRAGLGGETRHVLLGAAALALEAGRCDEPLMLNADATGYYRVAYDAATRAANLAAFAGLSPSDRLALLDDQWALVRGGRQPLASYLDMVAALQPLSQGYAWRQVVRAFDALERALRGRPAHERFLQYGLSVFEPLAARVGWDTAAGENTSVATLRRQVLELLADWGSAPVQAEALRRYRRFLADRRTLSADDQELVLGIVARDADSGRYAELLQLAQSATSSAEQRRYYLALAAVRDPALATRVAALAVDALPPQARRVAFLLVQGLAAEHPQLAWRTFQAHHELLMAASVSNGPSTLARTVPAIFWEAAPAEEIEAWLRRELPAAAVPLLASSMEGLRQRLRERELLARAAAELPTA